MNCDDKCSPRYQLKGPQVEPAAGYWQFCAKLRVVAIDELRQLTDNPTKREYFPPYPADKATIEREFKELKFLSAHRDDPCALVGKCKHEPPEVCEFGKDPKKLPEDDGCRRPISKLWNLCPYPMGGVLVSRFDGEQVIRTGRGLARAVESETPGLYHRHIATFLMRTRNWSPPRQALVWAALDVAIATALQAAWYYKWLAVDRNDGQCTAFRERPVEYANREKVPIADFTVLFDAPDELNPTYVLCPDARPLVNDPAKLRAVSPGTPRHPAYPSGHSTYSAAASEILKFFFGNDPLPPFLNAHPRLHSMPGTLGAEFDNLADNIGIGRLWAGVHWRSDHEAGQKLGRVVACMILRQLASMLVVDEKTMKPKEFDLCPPEPVVPCNQCDFDVKLDPCKPDKEPPKRADLCKAAKLVSEKCPKDDVQKTPDPCKAPPPCRKGKKEKALKEEERPMDEWSSRVDAYRGPQQGGN